MKVPVLLFYLFRYFRNSRLLLSTKEEKKGKVCKWLSDYLRFLRSFSLSLLTSGVLPHLEYTFYGRFRDSFGHSLLSKYFYLYEFKTCFLYVLFWFVFVKNFVQ